MTPTLTDLAQELPSPYHYAYRYPDGIRFHGDAREINGSMPIEAIPLYTKEQFDTAFLTACAQAERETAELRAEVDAAQINMQSVIARSDKWQAEAIAAQAELSALRAEAAEVLEPFAEAAIAIGAAKLPDSRIVQAYGIKDGLYVKYRAVTEGHLRAAAALLAKIDAGEA